MKRLFLIIAVLLLAAPLMAVELKLGGTEWSPYMGSQIKNHGIAAEIVSKIVRRAGHRVTFFFYPWTRTQHLVRTGELDGLGIAWFTEERAKTMAYTDPYVNTAIVLIKRRDDPFVYRTVSDLEGKTIGVILGYGYLKKIESDKIKKSFVKSLRQNLFKLVNHRIDLTMEEKLNAEIVLSTMPAHIQHGVRIMETPFEVKPLHMTLSKNVENYGAIIRDINEALAAMLMDGSYGKMIEGLRFKPMKITGNRISGHGVATSASMGYPKIPE